MQTELASQTRYNDQTITDLSQTKTRLDLSSFYECNFDNCSFVETLFHSCRFVDCSFNRCDLSLIQITSCVFSGVRFESSRLVGVDWTQADWKATSLGDPLRFTKCIVNHSTFIGINLSGIKIIDTSAKNVDFREVDLSRVDFTGTDLTDSLFANTNLTGADLTRAKNYTIKPETNNLKKAKFSLPEAMSLLFNLDIVLVVKES